MRREIDVRGAAQWLRERDGFLVLTHRRPDGDAVGSASALVRGLRLLGKKAAILPNPDITEKYNVYAAPYWAAEGDTFEHIVSVDMADTDMMTRNAAEYADKVELAVDHHGSNSGYAVLSCVIPVRASCGEIIYEILAELLGELDCETAMLLYVALSTDTGCFAYGNTDANAFRVAGLLAQAGAPVADLNKVLFRTKSRKRTEFECAILSNLDYYRGGAIAFALVSAELVRQLDISENEMDDIASLPGQIEGVEVGVTLKELSENSYKISLRTGKKVNASDVCGKFGGGGHAMAAGCSISGTLAEVKRALLKAIEENWPEK